MAESQIVMEFESPEALQREFADNLRRGGAFVQTAPGLDEGDPCKLVLVHPSVATKLELAARVVWVSPTPEKPGVGLQIENFSAAVREELQQFVDAVGPKTATATNPPPAKRPLHERVRRLSSMEQVKLARDGDLSERVMLERIYSKAVWDALLHNPRLTPPEVARLARMGTLPNPLLEQIAQNGSWLTSSQVRRALLTNRRLGRDLVTKVLRATPKAELKLVPKQTAYPATVRQAAKRMLQN